MSPVPYVADFAAPKPSLRHGDDVAPVRERRGTTPLAHSRVRRSTAGDDGPTRSVLLGWISCSSEGFPVMAGSVPLNTILVPGAKAPSQRPPMAESLTEDQQQRRRQAVVELMPSTPYMSWLGIAFEHYESDDVTIRLPFREDLTNDGTYYHGGVIAAAMDTTGAAAAWSNHDFEKGTRA